MSTKTIIAWVNGDAQEIEIEDVEYIIQNPTIEERLNALENVDNKKTVGYVTLLATDWIGDVSPYCQEGVEIEGITITPYSKINLQPSAEQLVIFHDKDLEFVTENEDGCVTIYALGDKPANDYVMQVTVEEVKI